MCPERKGAPEKVLGSAQLPAPRCRVEDIVTGDAQGPGGTARAGACLCSEDGACCAEGRRRWTARRLSELPV